MINQCLGKNFTCENSYENDSLWKWLVTRYIVMKITRPLLWSYVYMQFKDNYVADVKEGKRDYHWWINMKNWYYHRTITTWASDLCDDLFKGMWQTCTFRNGSDLPFIFDPPVLVSPCQKISSFPLFFKKILRGLIKPYSKVTKCLRGSERGLIPLFCIFPWTKILIHPILVQITHGLLSL